MRSCSCAIQIDPKYLLGRGKLRELAIKTLQLGAT